MEGVLLDHAAREPLDSIKLQHTPAIFAKAAGMKRPLLDWGAASYTSRLYALRNVNTAIRSFFQAFEEARTVGKSLELTISWYRCRQIPIHPQVIGT